MVQTGGRPILFRSAVCAFSLLMSRAETQFNAGEHKTETTVAEQSQAKCNRIFDQLITSNQHDYQVTGRDFNRIMDDLNRYASLFW